MQKLFWPFRLLFLCLTVVLGSAAHAAQSPELGQARYAILLGNSTYPGNLALPNPVNDVRAISNVLVELGFQIRALENGSLSEMRAHVRQAMQDVPDGSMVMFYYAGHAIQKNGLNWFLPVDFELPKGDDLSTVALGINEVLREIDVVDDVTKIIVLDACRNYPLGDAEEALGNGLASIIAKGETLVAYATLSGEVARDGTGPNSPYTGALVSALDIKGMELYDVFRTVRYKVRSATQGVQLPWVSGTLRSEIVLNSSDVEQSEDAIQLAGLDPIQAVHWNAISRSNDPSDFRAFLGAYSESPAKALAQTREQELTATQPDLNSVIQVADFKPTDAPFVVTACDQWVSDPLDPKRIAAGVPWGLVNTRHAIRDCSMALSADPDNARLSFLLGRALDIAESFDEARYFYEQAAADGYGVASRNLGYMYRNARGVPADDEVAAQHYFDAALDGIVDARKALAKLYEEGWGVEQSYPEMMRWLDLSAEENYPNSLDHLGNLYRTGKYVEKDLAKALELYEQGASVGYGNAIANQARVYRDGLGVPVDRPKAFALYQEAVDRGNAFAPYHLARMLLKPEGDEKRDPERALALLELSAERGYAWSLWQLARSWNSKDFGEPNLDNAAFYLWIAAEAGRSIRNKGGALLESDATELLKEIEPQLSQERRDAVETRTQQWLKQNSLLNFSLIFPY